MRRRRLGASKFRKRSGENPKPSGAAETLGASPGRSSSCLPPLLGRVPPDPPDCSTCRASPGSPAASAAHPRPASARAPASARVASLALFSPTSKFIHKTLRLSQPKGGELETGGETLPYPFPQGVEGPVPAQNLRQHQFLPTLGGCAERGGRKGTGPGRLGGAARDGEGSGKEEEQGFNSGVHSLSNLYLRKGGGNFSSTSPGAPRGSLRPSQS